MLPTVALAGCMFFVLDGSFIGHTNVMTKD